MTTATTTRPRWAFDRSRIADPLGYGARALKFFDALRHPKSTEPDKRIVLHPFWRRVVLRMYGPRTPQGKRIVRIVYVMVGRGARKTSVAAALGLLHAIGHERRPMSHSLLAGGSGEDQADLALEEAKAIVRATPALRKRVKVRSDYLEHDTDGSELRTLSADGDVSHGKTPVFACYDEHHTIKNRKLWKAIKTGLIKVPDALLVIITTAGRGQTGPAWEEYQYARRVALGEIENPSYLPVILEPEPGADWQDERVWHYVNPCLADGYPDLDSMRAAAIECQEKPADRDDFKQYNLNFWLDQSLSPFVDMAVFDGGAEALDLEALRGRECWVTGDLSTTTDLSCLLATFPDGDGGFTVLPAFFCPGDNLRRRAEVDKVPYPTWAEQKFITATPGNVIDYTAIIAKAREWHQTFKVKEFGFDRAYAQTVMQALMDDGLPVATISQGWLMQSPAVRDLECAIIARKYRHGGHPVLRWCFGNVAVHTDSNGNKTFHKGKSRDRIDGASAAWMGISRATSGENDGRSIYDRPIWDDKPAEAVANDDGTAWDGEILKDVSHPLFAEHRRRFERWQDAQPDEDW